MPGLADGFLKGFGFVSNIQDRQRQRELQAERLEQADQRYADEKAFRRQQAEYDRQRDQVGDERWEKSFGLRQDQLESDRAHRERSFEADQDYRSARLGLQQQRVGISAANARTASRRNDLAAQQQEIELSQLRRQERESQRRRSLEAAGQELQANGVTPRFRQLAQEGDVPIDQFDNPKWRKAKDTVIAGLQGAPIDHRKMVDATGTLFADRIDRVVGSKTKDGREIVRAALDDFVPGPDGDTVMLDLKVWARDDNGNVSEYNAPVTSNRNAADEFVMQVPVDDAIGYVKGLDILDKAVPREQIRSLLQQEQTLAGAQDSGADGDSYWVRGPGNTIFNRQTSESRTLPTIGDDKKRYSEAVQYAKEELTTLIGNRGDPGALSHEESEQLSPEQATRIKQDRRDRWFQERRRKYLEYLTPEETISDPDPAVVRKLEEEGGMFVAPGGKYEGREVMLKPDGSVVVR